VRWSIEFQWTGISLEVMSILTGIPLVDLSIEHEPHLVRGTE
jgi:hypothetical protein